MDASGPLQRTGDLMRPLLLDRQAQSQHAASLGTGRDGSVHYGVLNSISRITLAGAPAAITPAGMSRVTTEFDPMTLRSPI